MKLEFSKKNPQWEGIAAKKLRGEWDDYGRPKAIDNATFAQAYAKVERREITPNDLRRELGLSHSKFYRYRDQYLKSINT